MPFEDPLRDGREEQLVAPRMLRSSFRYRDGWNYRTCRCAVVSVAAVRLPTMGEVQVVQVDERDSGWENSRPRFRVYLHGSGPKSTYGWTDTYDVTGADVLQVIDWTQRQAGDSLTYAVALVHDDPARGQMDPGSGRGLVWLVGMDGNTNPNNPEEAETLDRMLARRREAVGVPLADRMPAGAPDPYNDGTQRR